MLYHTCNSTQTTKGQTYISVKGGPVAERCLSAATCGGARGTTATAVARPTTTVYNAIIYRTELLQTATAIPKTIGCRDGSLLRLLLVLLWRTAAQEPGHVMLFLAFGTTSAI